MANNIKQKIRNPKYLKSDGSFTNDYNRSNDDVWVTLNEYYYEDVYEGEDEERTKIHSDGDLLVYGKLKDANAVDTDNIVNGSITRDKLDANIVDGLEDIKWTNLSSNLQKQINSSGGVLIGPKNPTSSDDNPQPAESSASAEQKYYAKLWIETQLITS